MVSARAAARGGIAIAAIATCGACASMFIHGGRLVGRNFSVATATASYEIHSCRDANGAPGQSPEATYYVMDGERGPELLERAANGQGVLIANRWEDASGTHFFAWGAGLGWEFTLPYDGSPATRLGHSHPSSSEESDGTRRPVVSRPAASQCTLVLVSGSPPRARGAFATQGGAASQVGAAQPALVQPVAQPATAQPATAQPAALQPATVQPQLAGGASAAGSTCAAGRVETADGHCCPPGQGWDVAQRTCAAPAAGSCREGRVATDGGFCCWPGQRFDLRARVCAGPPRCPPGLGASGEDCVASR